MEYYTDLIETYVKLCDEYREKQSDDSFIPATQADIPLKAEWALAEPVRSMSPVPKREHVLKKLKSLFAIEQAPTLSYPSQKVDKNILLFLLRDTFNL